MEKTVTIGKRAVGDGQAVYIIAEAGINHNGDVDRAKEMVDTARVCGADAVKFQKFRARDFIASPGLTYTYRSQGKTVTEPMLEMFSRYEFDEDGWREIFAHGHRSGIDIFATPQNPADLDFLLSLADLPAIKVGSDDLTNLELLEYYAGKGKPLIISAGMACISEIDDAVGAVRGAGNESLIILHCTSSYPAPPDQVHLRKILTIRRAFGTVVGFSDHTVGSVAAVGAVALGAAVVEKHFTLDRDLPGPDHWFSADPGELAGYVRDVRSVEKALGDGRVVPTAEEISMRAMARRSITAARKIERGEVITRDAVTFKRPGTGLQPKLLFLVLGKRAKRTIRENEQITLGMIG
jgi:N-acetylneuraminate synthase/N,N'-diacetyllegionaminate synthase